MTAVPPPQPAPVVQVRIVGSEAGAEQVLKALRQTAGYAVTRTSRPQPGDRDGEVRWYVRLRPTASQ
ncbi:hypothetical protein AB0O31_03320 [Kitasatospora cineracea]|uniref:hypothetical protein n=1 Tax=Kitasatospora cineracea TaxID=88074 RepID=UPI00342C2922